MKLSKSLFLAPVLILMSLAACTTGLVPSNIAPASVLTQVNAVVTGLSGVLPQIVKQYPALIPPNLATTMETDLQLAMATSASLKAGMPAPQAAVTIAQVEGYVNDVLNTLAGPPINGLIPAPANQAFGAAAIIVPVLEAFVAANLPAGSQMASVASPYSLVALHSTTPDITTTKQAIDILNSFAKK